MTPVSPKVTVIIPTHNRAHVIRRALHSVLHQTYGNLEVIVVDDASTDNTGETVASSQDPRIIYLRHETRKGASAARNTGIRAASGDFIAFQDSDDEWLNQKLEKQMAVLLQASDDVGLVYSGFLRFEGKRATYCPSKRVKKKSGRILSTLLDGNFVTTQAVVVRKECLAKAGLFDEKLPRLQDWELFIRVAEYYEFACIDEPLLIAFHSPESITADESLVPVALKMILAKHEKLFLRHPRSHAKHCRDLSLWAFKTGMISDGGRYLVKSLRGGD